MQGTRGSSPQRSTSTSPVAQWQSARPITGRPRFDTVRENQQPPTGNKHDHDQETGRAHRRTFASNGRETSKSDRPTGAAMTTIDRTEEFGQTARLTPRISTCCKRSRSALQEPRKRAGCAARGLASSRGSADQSSAEGGVARSSRAETSNKGRLRWSGRQPVLKTGGHRKVWRTNRQPSANKRYGRSL